jgi:hypothetical protein
MLLIVWPSLSLPRVVTVIVLPSFFRVLLGGVGVEAGR